MSQAKSELGLRTMREYEVAESLYQGDLLEENPYEDWLIPRLFPSSTGASAD
jgi:hypothetical protein